MMIVVVVVVLVKGLKRLIGEKGRRSEDTASCSRRARFLTSSTCSQIRTNFLRLPVVNFFRFTRLTVNFDFVLILINATYSSTP